MQRPSESRKSYVNKNNEKLDVLDVFNLWAGTLNDPKQYSVEDKYDKSKRIEHIEFLAAWLQDYNIDYEDAKGLRNKVMVFLTTEEGRKGKGKYKNWKENALQDFDQTLARMYMDIPKSPSSSTVADPFRIKQDDAIVNWAEAKYGEDTLVIAEAHRIASPFYFEYLEDTFY